MKKLRKLFILLAFVAITIAGLNVTVSAGYTYSHDGKIISSPAGYSATIDGVYNVLSTAWNGQINEKEFNSPEDLFIYQEEKVVDGKTVTEDFIYVVSSSTSVDSETKVCYNTLFKFDGNLNFIEKVNQFEVIYGSSNVVKML